MVLCTSLGLANGGNFNAGNGIVTSCSPRTVTDCIRSYCDSFLLEPQPSAMETHSVNGIAGLCNALPPKGQGNPAEVRVSSVADKSELVSGALS